MKLSRLLVMTCAFAGLVSFGAAARADAGAGKTTFTSACSQCHEASDFEGEDPAEISATLKKMVGGQMRHKKPLNLTDAEIADVAAYLVSGGK